MKKGMLYLPIIFVLSILLSFTVIDPTKPTIKWNVPSEYVNMKNPVKKDESSMKLGKSMFTMHCSGCHGLKGKGDGDRVKNLVNLVPANLSLNKITSETDGDHFYKIKFGRDNLHGFKGKLDDEAIWSIVHYIKTFAAK